MTVLVLLWQESTSTLRNIERVRFTKEAKTKQNKTKNKKQ